MVLLSKLLPQFVHIGHELILDLLPNLGLAMTLLFLSISFIEQVTTTINLRLTEQMIFLLIPKLSHLILHRRQVQYLLYTRSIFLILQEQLINNISYILRILGRNWSILTFYNSHQKLSLILGLERMLKCAELIYNTTQ